MMSVTVALSAATGKPLSEKDMESAIKGCDEIIFLDNAKQ